MLATIQLKGQLLLVTVEIQYENLDWVLPVEFVFSQTPVAQELLETTFQFCLIFSELSGENLDGTLCQE